MPAAGPDNVLETDVYNRELGHADKHNAVNAQVNYLTEQVAGRLSTDALVTATDARVPAVGDTRYARIGAAVRPLVRSVPASKAELTAGAGSTSGTGATFNLADTQFVKGASCVRITTNGAGGNAQYTFPVTTFPWDLTGKFIRLTVRLDDYVNLAFAVLYLDSGSTANRFVGKVDDTSARNTIKVVRQGEWAVLDMPRSLFTTDAGTPSWANITGARFLAQDKNGVAVQIRINSIEQVPIASALPNGAVIWTFDDSFAAHKAIASPYMDKYGARGTLFPIANSTDLTVADLKRLRDYSGWECGVHAMSVTDHSAIYVAQSDNQVRARFDALKSWAAVNGLASDSFAWPIGDSDPASEAIAKEYFATACSTAAGIQPVGMTNPFRLRRWGLNAFANTAAGTAKIDEAKASAGLLIVMVHGIVASGPSGNDGLTSVFQGMVDYAVAQGVPQLTLTDALSRIGAI